IDKLETDPDLDPKSPFLPIVACNLLEREKYLKHVQPWKVVEVAGSSLKVGVVGALGPSVVEAVRAKDPRLRFEPVPDALPRHYQDMNRGRPEVKVLLYQGTVEQAAALAQSKQMPSFQVILCLSEDEEPPGKAENVVGDTSIFSVGHKGKYVGVV